MSQNQLNFPIDIKKSTKHLVYADIKKSRTYHESNDDMDFFPPTKTEYKTETIVIGVVDNGCDVPSLNQFIQEKVKDSPYHWTVESVKFRASEVDYFKFE
tara:strand:+ start:3675 stop:3974 length:300 start_codon:yes stop_codon:yes gene_type:complete